MPLVVYPRVSPWSGVGLTPPMGWRHWKAFYADISQDIMEDMMEEMASPTLCLKDTKWLFSYCCVCNDHGV